MSQPLSADFAYVIIYDNVLYRIYQGTFMRAVNDKIEGPLLIDEDLAVHGMITAGAVVRTGRKLVLHGMITGDLVIEPKARVIIHGMVNGVVINDGGRVEIFGTVDAVADRSADAVTIIDPVAHVKGRR